MTHFTSPPDPNPGFRQYVIEASTQWVNSEWINSDHVSKDHLSKKYVSKDHKSKDHVAKHHASQDHVAPDAFVRERRTKTPQPHLPRVPCGDSPPPYQQFPSFHQPANKEYDPDHTTL